ncbi:MAG: 23S rRNA (adenine(1618)-N(6))-methyltransferase RlmF [Elusimicrobiota bacterium]|nr:23S rRNA (adenine(1618)-N(6))-methyltransferase RlmF [Elusimicrobiota bacterium]
MHPRNRHRGRYDLERLCQGSPELRPFVRPSPAGEPTVDFADPAAVAALNRALLREYYGVPDWRIPPGYLCPPVPGRADYIHHAADLLAGAGEVPRGDAVRVLDMGVGANAIYPIIGRREYGWSFVGVDADPVALESARAIVASTPGLEGGVELRLQRRAARTLEGALVPGERFDLTVCNPPFHASPAEADAAARRKRRGLGQAADAPRNFAGRATELCFPGGEDAFIRSLIEESAAAPRAALWFTSLVSKAENLADLERAARKAGAVETRVVPMGQGRKVSRFLAWTFERQELPPGHR